MSVTTRGLSATLWRRIAAALCHVPGVEADITLETGDTSRVAANVGGDGPSIDEVRAVVVEALGESPAALLPVHFPTPGGEPASVDHVVLRGRATQAIERGTRWRHSCSCRVTDYVLTELGIEDSLSLGNSVLGDVVASPLRYLWARRDRGLEVTVLAFDWPPDLSEAEEVSVDQALRDLSVMCRIRASVDEL